MKKISVFLYSIRQGFKNLRKNRMFTVASVGTIAACLFLFGLFYFVAGNFQHMIRNIGTSVSITAFFEEGISEEQIEIIGKTIRERPEVSDVRYISAEEAWERFQEERYADSRKQITDTFGEDNPLAESASYEIYLKDISQQESLVAYTESVEGIRQVNRSDEIAENLANINKLVGYVSGSIILILFVVAMFLIRTSIATGITVRKTEIGIMRLIGASDYFIRAPFVVEGVLLGMIGAVIPLAILYFIYERVIEYIAERFESLTGILTFLSTGQIFSMLIPLCLSLGIGIGFFGSFLTVRRHLHV